jgi:hypothetical protein
MYKNGEIFGNNHILSKQKEEAGYFKRYSQRILFKTQLF